MGDERRIPLARKKPSGGASGTRRLDVNMFIRISSDEKDALEQIAINEQRSIAGQARVAIREHLQGRGVLKEEARAS